MWKIGKIEDCICDCCHCECLDNCPLCKQWVGGRSPRSAHNDWVIEKDDILYAMSETEYAEYVAIRDDFAHARDLPCNWNGYTPAREYAAQKMRERIA